MLSVNEACPTSDQAPPGGAMNAILPTLTAARLPWTLTCHRDLRLPAWKGSMLHGALGWAVADLAGSAPTPTWPGLVPCALPQALFDPQHAWASPLATAPWSLRCPDHRELLRAEEPLQGELLLYGPWPAWAVAMLGEALVESGQRGLTAQRVQLRCDLGTLAAVNCPAAPIGSATCTLHLLTPCRLKDRGRDCSALHPPALVRSLLRRSRQLHLQLVGSEPPWADRYEELSHACEALYAENDQSRPVDLDRWSNRQERHVRMDAVAGSVRIAGATLPLLAPWLAAAPILHLGRQPTFGLGQVEVEFYGVGQELPNEPVLRTP